MCYNRFLSCYNRFFNCYNKVLICYNKLKTIILVALPSFCRDRLLLFFSYFYISFYLIKLYIVPVFGWFFFSIHLCNLFPAMYLDHFVAEHTYHFKSLAILFVNTFCMKKYSILKK